VARIVIVRKPADPREASGVRQEFKALDIGRIVGFTRARASGLSCPDIESLASA